MWGGGEGGFWVICESWLLKMSLVVVGSGRIKDKFLKGKSLDNSAVHIPFHSLQKLLAVPYPIHSSFTPLSLFIPTNNLSPTTASSSSPQPHPTPSPDYERPSTQPSHIRLVERFHKVQFHPPASSVVLLCLITPFLFSSLPFPSLPTSLAQTPLLETTTISENFANQTKATPRTNFHPPC